MNSRTSGRTSRASNGKDDQTDPSYWSEKLWSEDGPGDFIWDEGDSLEDETGTGKGPLPSVNETGDFIWDEGESRPSADKVDTELFDEEGR